MEEKNVLEKITESRKPRKEIEKLKLTLEEKDIINYLDNGYKERQIAEILHRHKDTIYRRIREINRKKVALAQIVRKCQKQELKTKDGENIIRLLIEEGLITEEQIEQNSKLEKIKPIILEAIKNRLSIEQIIEKCGEYNLRESDIEKVISLLIEEGAITKKEIKKWEEDVKIIAYFNENYSNREIAKLIGKPSSSIDDRINKLMREGFISKKKNEEQKEIFMQRIIERCKKYNLKESDIEKIINVLVKEDEMINREIKKWEEDIKIISYLNLGYSVREIEKMIKRDNVTVYMRMDKLIELGIISKEKIEEYRQLRKIKEKVIIAEIMKGRFVEDIIEQFKNTEFRESDIKNIITRLLEKNLLGREQIKYREQQMKIYKVLKRETYPEVKFGKKPTYKKDEQIKEYIILCNKIYINRKIPKQELQDLKRAIEVVSTIDEKEIINFIRHCSDIEAYKEAMSILNNKQIIEKSSISEENKPKLKRLQNIIETAYQIQQAKKLINKGNTNTEVISEVTGLTPEKVNILKIQLEGKEIELLDVNKREQVINWLLQDIIAGKIQAKFGITDFEMRDIEQQANQRRYIQKDKEIDLETKVRQNSTLRIILLYKKLGKSTESISEILNIDINKVEKYIKAGLKWNLIKEDEIDGIKLLDNLDKNLEEIERTA